MPGPGAAPGKLPLLCQRRRCRAGRLPTLPALPSGAGPGHASVDARGRLARAAAARLEDGSLDEGGLAALATDLGVTDRHLRRVFQDQFGVTPVAYAQTRRLLLAKQLLTDTNLPVTEVALAAGFGSLRRFNALFRQRYRLKPSSLRRRPGRAGDSLSFLLAYRPPYPWAPLADFLGQRAIAGSSTWMARSTGAPWRCTVASGCTGAGWRWPRWPVRISCGSPCPPPWRRWCRRC